ncbi:helix-turn-helix transcriptional regulator [bacterium]|nr:helix-turn-helix transcriptional regulator [bacterium]
MILTHIGEKIREERESLGISREKMAMILGVSPMTIYAWEKGRRSPIRDMSNFIEIDSSELIREIREERTKY